MLSKQSFVTDERGQRIGVILDITEFERLLEALEELESIRAYDAAKASDEEAIPLDQAVAELERER